MAVNVNNRQVYLNNNEISEYITQMESVTEQIPNYGEIQYNVLNTITVDNTTNAFDFLYTIDPSSLSQKLIITINEFDQTVFSGFVTNYESDWPSVIILTLGTKINDVLNRGCLFVSDVVNTNPASIALEMCNRYGIPVNTPSFIAASVNYSNDSYDVSVVSTTGERTVMEMLQYLCEVGVASMYFSNGVFYWDQWRTSSVPVVGMLYACDMFTETKVTNPIKEIATSFTIKWISGSYTLGDPVGSGRGVTADSTSEIRVNTLNTAVNIAGRWVQYLGSPVQIIDTFLPNHIAASCVLGLRVNVEIIPGTWKIISLTRASNTLIACQLINEGFQVEF